MKLAEQHEGPVGMPTLEVDDETIRLMTANRRNGVLSMPASWIDNPEGEELVSAIHRYVSGEWQMPESVAYARVQDAHAAVHEPPFPLGRIVLTNTVHHALGGDEGYDEDLNAVVRRCVERHRSGDWGDPSSEDARENDNALKNGRRILSIYRDAIEGNDLWIITEWDRSATTILFPDDY